MGELRSRSNKLTYILNVQRLLERVYYSKVREVTRELVGLKYLEKEVYGNIERLDIFLQRKLNLGYSFLIAESRDSFLDTVSTDDEIIEDYQTLSDVGKAMLDNLFIHFCCELAFQLIDTTDIEDYLDSRLKLIRINNWYVIFTYED